MYTVDQSTSCSFQDPEFRAKFVFAICLLYDVQCDRGNWTCLMSCGFTYVRSHNFIALRNRYPSSVTVSILFYCTVQYSTLYCTGRWSIDSKTFCFVQDAQYAKLRSVSKNRLYICQTWLTDYYNENSISIDNRSRFSIVVNDWLITDHMLQASWASCLMFVLFDQVVY